MNHWVAVVDDDVLCLDNARNMLGGEGMRLSCLRSGKDLLRFIEKNTPDLILLDILMPDMDGFETYDALRKLEKELGRAHIPVIFLTGENDAAVEQRGLELGASDFIRKPFNKEITLKRIDNTIKSSKTIENLKEEVNFDDLTGFLSKARGTDRISKLCSRKTGALMVLDLDSFKLVNDLFGHDMGDRVLKAFSDIIRRNTRETDTISRIGGDEFLAFYEDLIDESAVASLALRLNTQLNEEAEKLLGEDHGIPLGISIGVVMVPEEGRDYDTLFGLADSALATVKQNGKHGYHVYSQMESDGTADGTDPQERLERILKIIEERNDMGGALLLGTDSFALIYRFIMRFYKRYGGTASLMLLTLVMDKDVDNLRVLEISTQFTNLLKKTLRMSDIIMQNGPDSFFMLLTERTQSEAERALKRIFAAWEDTGFADEVKIVHAIRYIELEE